MTIKLASLRADLAREENGDWIDFPDWPGIAFNVSSLHLSAYQNARDALLKRLNAEYDKREIPKSVITAGLGKVYAEYILHGWRGLDVAYSREVSIEVLSDPAYRNIVAAVEWCASQVSQVKIEFVEGAIKNSEAPSGRASATSAKRRTK